MDKEFKKFVELSELYYPGDPEAEKDKILDDIAKMDDALVSLRDGYNKFKSADPEQKDIYKSIIYKYFDIIDMLWVDIKENLSEKKLEGEEAIVIKKVEIGEPEEEE